MRTLLTLADRTAVLFLGVAAGRGDRLRLRQRAGAAEVAAPPRARRRRRSHRPRRPAAGTALPAGPAPPSAAPNARCRSAPRLLGTVSEGRKVRVGVFGDSYGDGIWSALYHLLPAKDGYEVVKFSQQSTGFTRYASLNLEEHAREQLAGNPVDIAVVSFGANDTQGVLAGNHARQLLGPGMAGDRRQARRRLRRCAARAGGGGLLGRPAEDAQAASSTPTSPA